MYTKAIVATSLESTSTCKSCKNFYLKGDVVRRGVFNFSGRLGLTCEQDLYQCGIETYMLKGNRNKATC